MNIFVLDADIEKCVEYMADKHIVKMLTETAQILNTAYYFTGECGLAQHKLTHTNHPCCLWARHSIENWLWLQQTRVSHVPRVQIPLRGAQDAQGGGSNQNFAPAQHNYFFFYSLGIMYAR